MEGTGTARNPAVVADFDTDGRVDALVPGAEWGDALYLAGNGDGTFAEERTQFFGQGERNATGGDFDGDGRADLAFGGGYYGVLVVLGNGDGTFQAPITLATPNVPGVPVVDDFTGDGRDDIVVSNDSGLSDVLWFFPTV